VTLFEVDPFEPPVGAPVAPFGVVSALEVDSHHRAQVTRDDECFEPAVVGLLDSGFRGIDHGEPLLHGRCGGRFVSSTRFSGRK
jgi:hypothetical protein